MVNKEHDKEFNFLRGGGELGEITRNYNWSQTAIGTPEHWPHGLRAALSILLHSAFPMFIWWGKDLTCFYNDAYRPSLGIDGKHPAVGKGAKEVWPEIWHFIGPLIEQVMTTGKAVWFENQYLPIYRNGSMEDVYWTFSYSPIYGDNGDVEGVLVTCTETTEKVKALKRLTESENRFNNLIKEAPVGMVVLDGDDLIVKVVNEAYGKLIERTPEELLDKPLFTIIPELEAHFRPLIRQVMDTGVPLFLNDQEYSLTKDGKLISGYLDVVYQPYRLDDNTITGLVAIVSDVTARVLLVKKMESTEQRIRSIIESTPFPIGVYTGREMRIEFLNQSIIDVWGKGKVEVGKLYKEILPELEGSGIYEQLEHVFDTGVPFHAKHQRVDLVVDGVLTPFYFNYSFTPLYDAEGKIYGVMNTAADVTDIVEAKQRIEESEHNLRAMILQAPVAMCILQGPKHIVDVANDMMIDLWGKPKDDVMGKPIFEALPDAREQGLESLMRDVFENGNTFKANEMPVKLLRNGQWDTVYQNFVYEPYLDADGKTIGVLAVTIDVTEQVLARQQIERIVAERTEELAAANTSLKKSNEDLAQFAYVASHDLQEPVRKVITFTEMLETNLGQPDERSKNFIEKIKTSSNRMRLLIKDVLAFSELSKINTSFSAVSLKQIVDDAKTDFELLIEQKDAHISSTNLPVLEAIPLHMAQLFGNLISNALKYTRPGVNPNIEITAGELQHEVSGMPKREGGYYTIEVSDNGAGFAPEYADQIFKIFQRLHGKNEYEGTGIGLALCQKIVQNHGGKIFANSEPGVGTTFTIILPAKQI